MQLAPSVPFPSPAEAPAAGIAGLPAMPAAPTAAEGETAVEFADLLPPAEPATESETKKSALSEDPASLLWAAGCFPPVMPPPTSVIAPPPTGEAPADAGVLESGNSVAPTLDQSASDATLPIARSPSALFSPSSVRAFGAARPAGHVQSETTPLAPQSSSLATTEPESPTEPSPQFGTEEVAQPAVAAPTPVALRVDGKTREERAAVFPAPQFGAGSDAPAEKKIPAPAPATPVAPAPTDKAAALVGAHESGLAAVLATLPENNRPGAMPRVRWTPPVTAATHAQAEVTPTLGSSVTATEQGEARADILPREAGKFPAITPESVSGMEKFAARGSAVAAVTPVVENMRQKYFLNASRQTDVKHGETVGIDVAKDQLVMPSLAPNRSPSAPAADKSVFPAVEVTTSLPAVPGSGVGLSAEKPLAMGNVRETMAAVATAVEALESRALAGPSVVNLHFQVGAEKLALHLELHDGTMHTTFRTDSPELRAALGQEWQAAAPGLSTRDVTIAAPVFAPAAVQSSDLAQSSAGQGQPQQRGQHAPEAQPLFPGRATAGVSTPTSAPAATPAAAPAGSASLLHAFA